MKQITISGIIGWDITADNIRQALRDADGAPVELVISSPGGLVSDALDIYNQVRNYPGAITARLAGYAMSAASYIPMAADQVIAEDNAVFMIHNVQGGVLGDHNDILKYGQMCKNLSRVIAQGYARRTGKPVNEIAAMMDVTTYLFGDEMVDNGFVDAIVKTDDETDRETALATAAVAFESCANHLAAHIGEVKTDLAKAASLTGGLPHRQPAATAKSKGEKIMTLEQLRADHPDLVEALVAEATEGMISAKDHQQAVENARREGAEAERQRIADCRAQALPGHEDLVEQMAFDGKSTGADVAMAIVAAEKALRARAADDIDADANDPVDQIDTGSGATTMKRTDFDKLSPAEQASYVKSGGKIID